MVMSSLSWDCLVGMRYQKIRLRTLTKNRLDASKTILYTSKVGCKMSLSILLSFLPDDGAREVLLEAMRVALKDEDFRSPNFYMYNLLVIK